MTRYRTWMHEAAKSRRGIILKAGRGKRKDIPRTPETTREMSMNLGEGVTRSR